jgi:hypothetical protein
MPCCIAHDAVHVSGLQVRARETMKTVYFDFTKPQG